ncbi:hypothetical protein GCM10025872_23870 [Barrientosiimonas endolithica]|uniref:Glycerol-3-phosphate dehydrogenase n=1 Tax=Barrientosiimonas endolithica TaxID=1535208 RepID=A0ABM8HCN8_9MICO|nr:hypothetical protein GCM10025872_23870 [Barrientosiimonas endolithica]
MSAPSPAGGRGPLNRTQRRGALERAAERTYDVVVVGGGVTGCGVALDAASRGLSVLLVEQHDLAAGTSRWSSKLVHGGLRYLASGHVGVAHESARERHLLMTRIAPHLVAPMPTLVPLGRDVGRRQGALIRLGVTAGDVLRRSARTPSSLLPGPDGSAPPPRCGSRRGSPPTGCAAGCCRTTDGSRTTRAWSSRSPERPPRPGPTWSPARGSTSSTPSGSR